MATITIKYTAPIAPTTEGGAQICRLFYPENAAADMSAFEGTYYDTNVQGWGEATSLDQFMKDAVAHPGLVAAIRAAIRDGEYAFETEDEKLILYMGEVAPALVDQGIEISVIKNS